MLTVATVHARGVELVMYTEKRRDYPLCLPDRWENAQGRCGPVQVRAGENQRPHFFNSNPRRTNVQNRREAAEEGNWSHRLSR